MLRGNYVLLISENLSGIEFLRKSLGDAGIQDELVAIDYREYGIDYLIRGKFHERSDLNFRPTAIVIGGILPITTKLKTIECLQSIPAAKISRIVVLAASDEEYEAILQQKPDSNVYPINIKDTAFIPLLKQILTNFVPGERAFGAQSYLELINAMLLILSTDGRVLMINQKGCELLGYKRSEVIGRKWLDDFLPEKVRPEISSLLHHLASGEAELPENHINPVITHTGEEKTIEWHNTALRDHQGHIFAILSSGNDITERLRVEKALRNSEEKYRSLIENLPIGIAVATLDGRSVTRNRATQEMHGYSSKEEFDRLLAPDLYFDPEERKQFLETLARGPVKNFEVRHKRKDGSIFWVSLTAIPQINEWGEKHLLTVTQDIEERRRAEEALRVSEGKFRSLIENAPIGITVTTPDGRRLEANKTIVKMHGYDSREEYLNAQTQDTYYDPADREKVMALVEKGPVQNFELRRKRKDGSIFWSSFSSVSFVSTQGEKLFINIVQDITRRKQALDSLRASEEKFRNLVENAPVGISISTPDGFPIERNIVLQKMHGYDSKEEFMNVPAGDLYCDIADRRRFMEAASKGTVKDFEAKHWRKDGSSFWVSQTSIPMTDESGKQQFTVIIQDITDRKVAEEALKRSEEKFRTIFNHSGDAIFIQSFGGRFIEVNKTASDLFGFSHNEFLMMTPSDIESPEFVTMSPERMRELIDRGQVFYETAYVTRDRKTIPVEIQSNMIDYEGKPVVLSVVRDISERKKMEETIRQLAYHDPLTGLPNRTLFSDRLHIALARARRYRQKLVIAIMDLNHFKSVNDTMGHEAGDDLLLEVGKRLTELMRKSDTVARFGGDEFVLLFPDLNDDENTGTIGQKILNAFDQPFVVRGKEARISASVGLAIFPDHGEDADTLIGHADDAMYLIKVQGRNNYFVYSSNTRQ